MSNDNPIKKAEILRGSTGDLHLWRVFYTKATKLDDNIARLITTKEIKLLHKATSDFLGL